MDFNEIILVLVSLFAITDPIGVIPLYLAFTSNVKTLRPKIARIASITMAIILAVSVFGGEAILSFFSVSLDAFRVAGGILILFMALEMLRARIGREKHTPEEDEEAISSTSVAIIPLAIPLLAGPGAISTVILLSGQHEAFTDKVWIAFSCVLISVLTWLVLHWAPQIERRISATAINIIMRIMGLVLAAISVQFIAEGLRNLLPGLGG